MMQLFVRGLQSQTHAVDVQGSDSDVSELREAIKRQAGIPSSSQGLVYAGKELQNGRCLSSYGIENHSTLTLVLRLRGGKGGFGALLRGLGRDGSKTTNFDAMRDLQGRRLRQKNGEDKLNEWAAQAKERELEKVALKHIKEQAKKADREEKAQVETESVVKAQKEVVNRVQSAVQDALADAPLGSAAPALAGSKRSASGAPASGSGGAAKASGKVAAPAVKRPKVLAALENFGSDESDSDSDDE